MSPDYPIPSYEWDDVPGYEDRHVESVVRPAIEQEIAAAVAERDARIVVLERENAQLNRRLFPGQGEVYANEVERQRHVIDGLKRAAERHRTKRDEWKARAENAEARAEALQEKIDRCVALIREGQQLQPGEPDAGLEALVVGWTKYHGDSCSFKSRAEKAKARLAKVRALEQRARRELVKRDFKGAAVVLADDIHTALTEPEDGQ